MELQKSRRQFLFAAAAAGSSALLLAEPLIAKTAEKKEEVEIGPAEDLMREHGGLNRILLIYEEGLRRIKDKKDFDPAVLRKSAALIRSFIENYHEKLEEEFIFPRMRKQKKLVDLVDTLETQHKAGRMLTATIEKLSVPATLKTDSDKDKLVSSLEMFIRMYRPHESREDTILFPTFHESMTEKEYDTLGEKFEDREHKLFGKDGFEGIVVQISELEKAFGIYDLAQFTPRV
jgi:hemerythrin-like domain-containing protein